MTYSLRLFRSSDATALAGLTLAAIRSVGAARYSAEQVDAWASRHPGPDRFLERAAQRHQIFVAVDNHDAPVAYSLIEPPTENGSHLDMLYCHPDHTRRGLANKLLSVAEDSALQDGAARLFTEASELARPAFERAGYAVTHRREFEVEGPNGPVMIHNFAMEKTL